MKQALLLVLPLLALSACFGGNIKSVNAELAGLTVSAGTLSPAFSSEQQLYYLGPDGMDEVESVTFTATAAHRHATITVDGVDVPSGSVSSAITVAVGLTPITIQVTAEDGEAFQNYDVVINRGAASTNAELVELDVSEGTLSPAFSSAVQLYQLGPDGLEEVESVTFTPTAADRNATITVDGSNVPSGSASSAITVAVGLTPVSIQVTAEDGETVKNYDVVINRQVEQPLTAYVKASNTDSDDRFGDHIALDGDTLVVGARNEDSSATGVNGNQGDNLASDSGAAYVFVRDGNTWTQQAYLKASNTESGDGFGARVAIDGDTIAVAAWEEDSNATGINGDQGDNSSASSGAVYVFMRGTPAFTGGSTWTQQAYVKASNTDSFDLFGAGLSLSDDTLVVGASGEDSSETGVNTGGQEDNSASGAGAAYVFVREFTFTGGTIWTQQAYIKASNTDASDDFGGNLTIDNDTLVIGAEQESSSATGVGGNQEDNSSMASGAVYVFIREFPLFTAGSTWTQQAYIKASNTDSFDLFGVRLSLNDDTLVVGAIGEDSSATGVDGDQGDNSAPESGAAYVFVREFPVPSFAGGPTWTQQAYLKAFNTEAGDDFGSSVAIHGDAVIVGAKNEDSNATGVDGDQTNNQAQDSGAAYGFVRDGNTWTQEVYVKAINTNEGDLFGSSVAFQDWTFAAGASQEDSNATGVNGDPTNNSSGQSGAIYIISEEVDPEPTYVKASNTEAGDLFTSHTEEGHGLAIHGDTLVVGAPDESSNATGVNGDQTDNSLSEPGAAYVFVRTGTTWTQEAYLKASNTGAEDHFGASVAIHGDTIVIGAPGEGSNATGVGGDQTDNSLVAAGAAYVFVRTGTTWTQDAYLKASNTDAEDSFGNSVAVHGDTVVVAAAGEASDSTGIGGDETDNSAPESGAVYVFVHNSPTFTGGSTWAQQAYIKAASTDEQDKFGYSIAAHDNTVVVGAAEEDSNAIGSNGDPVNNQANNSGAAYIFVRNGNTWTQEAYLKASNTDDDDRFGNSVAIHGDTVVIGAWEEDCNSTGVNGDQTNNQSQEAGAAYVFVREFTFTGGTNWTQQAYLKASNTDEGDYFGNSVAIHGDVVVIGAWEEDSNATGINGDEADNSAEASGAAYRFSRDGNTWTQELYLKASVADQEDFFGNSVAVHGDTVVTGAAEEDGNATGINNGDPANNSAEASGAAYIFQ